MTRIFHEVLGIAPDHIYVKYDDIKDYNTVCMNIFLEHLSEAYPDDYIVLVCDGAMRSIRQ